MVMLMIGSMVGGIVGYLVACIMQVAGKDR